MRNQKHAYSADGASEQAFTFTELIVILGMLVCLGALFFPAFARTSSASASLHCQNNLKQIAAAWQMYSADNQGHLVPSYPNYGANISTWCAGSARIGGGVSYGYGGADPAGITNGLLWSYIQSLRTYRCPLDRRLATEGPPLHRGKPILRTYSMNSYMNGASFGASPSWVITNPTSPQDPNHPVFRNEAEITRPAATWVVVDEDPLSVNDGMFCVDVSGGDRLRDMPTRAHDNGYWISFADGHTDLFLLRDSESISWDGLAPGPWPWGGLNDWAKLVSLTTYALE